MHPSAHMLIELGGIVFALGILARLANRIGLSPIPLYLLAGLAFGRGGVLPLVSTEDFVEVAAEIGVILLLLMLGLEYSPAQLVSSLKSNRMSGVADLLLNATPGLVAGLLLGWGPIPAIVLAGITYVSSSGIIAKMLSDMGRLGNRETPTVLSILVMEDLAMAAFLPIITALVVGGGFSNAAFAVFISLVAAALILFIALRYGPSLTRLIESPTDEILILLVLGLALAVAGVAESVHVSAGVGAFLVGIALSDQAAKGARPLLRPLRDIFSAVFFVTFGLNTDPHVILSVLLPAVGLAVVTAGTKLLTGWLATRNQNMTTRERLGSGLTLIPRGEFSIVLAGIAVAADLQDDLGPLAAAYVLLLAVTGPILSRLGASPARV